jgi:hypothetical protein
VLLVLLRTVLLVHICCWVGLLVIDGVETFLPVGPCNAGSDCELESAPALARRKLLALRRGGLRVCACALPLAGTAAAAGATGSAAAARAGPGAALKPPPPLLLRASRMALICMPDTAHRRDCIVLNQTQCLSQTQHTDKPQIGLLKLGAF